MPQSTKKMEAIPKCTHRSVQADLPLSMNDAEVNGSYDDRLNALMVSFRPSPRHPRRTCHAKILKQMGLPPNLGEAARVLGINYKTLYARFVKAPKSVFAPVRRYTPRKPNAP